MKLYRFDDKVKPQIKKSNMKQTAVEWLIHEISAKDWWYLSQSMKQDIIQQAKEMEKEQIIEAFDMGLITENIYYGYDDKKASQYYNETFKPKQI